MGGQESKPQSIEQKREVRKTSDIKFSAKPVQHTFKTYKLDIASLERIVHNKGVQSYERIVKIEKDKIIEDLLECKIDDINDDSKNKIKTWFCGSYKVGKSTLMNCLIGAEVMKASDVYHTKGEDIFINDTVMIDTEGFYQPLDTEEPFVRQDLLMYHMKYWCDVLVLVVDRILEHELRLMNDIIREYFGSQIVKQIIIIHNVKTISRKENLVAYVKTMLESLKVTGNYTNFIQNKWFSFDSYINLQDCVTHIFIGDIRTDLHLEQIEFIKSTINNIKPGLREFHKSLELCLRDLIKKYFEYETFSILKTESSLAVRLTKEKRTLQSNEMALRIENKMRLRWFASTEVVDGKPIDYLLCQISLNEFLLQGVDIIDSRAIYVKGVYRDLSTYSAYVYIENITPPVEIYVNFKPVIMGIDYFGSYLVKLVPNDKMFKSKVSDSKLDDIFKTYILDDTWKTLTENLERRKTSSEMDKDEKSS